LNSTRLSPSPAGQGFKPGPTPRALPRHLHKSQRLSVCPMPFLAGKYQLGPENASLRVETERHGAAAKAGHDLVIEVGSWEGTLEVGEDPGQSRVALSADTGSMHVVEGTGGVVALTEEDKVEIKKTLEAEVLKAGQVEFKSTQVTPLDGGERLRVTGQLSMNGNRHDLGFELRVSPEGEISGRATVRQSDWGIKPYSGLFGTLKVRDEVEVIAVAMLPA
jgi:polyisoprenoid-binding protein YceI